ncbi:MAG TPA: phenylalanine--tRNA ligase subunit beta [Gammaproteobacteria bacterium]|nr:phenylalanine--tRNA ligase subunit beta [Gammaproteobacteria bacterium]
MKISLAWLGEWVDALPDAHTAASQLTLAGLEVAAVEPAAPEFSGVVVGRVLDIGRHPNADKLTVCRVDAGQGAPLTIVCGATNVHADMRAPVALPGASLPGGLRIRATRLRGVESQGMLCSSRELGLGTDAAGILPLSTALVPGTDLRHALALDDHVLDLELTANRGDCLSVRGVARELAVINRATLAPMPEVRVAPLVNDRFPVQVEDRGACPRFASRIVRDLDAGASTPAWLAERLRRSGVRPLHPVVDVTQYVMLELGQPLHAYDLSRLADTIVVRRARNGEKLALLDGRTVELDGDVLVIADGSGAIGMAGIMGGTTTGVTAGTRDILLESAFFAPHVIAGRARRYGLATDASQRFERGVDYELQAIAIERATSLLQEIAGGRPGPVQDTLDPARLPARTAVTLREARLAGVLGLAIDAGAVGDILGRLAMRAERVSAGWTVTPPTFRFDVSLEEDLIEEVARIHGYGEIPETPTRIDEAFVPHAEARVEAGRIGMLLADRGYQEVITYSFVEPALQSMLAPGAEPVELANPISKEMSVMRASLWPGLVGVARENLNRQHARVRLFELGVGFENIGEHVRERRLCAGLVAGAVLPEQWSAASRPADFHDIKADVEALLALGGCRDAFSLEPAGHPVLRPGQSARVMREGRGVGWLGALHPETVRALDLTYSPLLFELEMEPISAGKVPASSPISRFPALRRDLAVVVDEAVDYAALRGAVREAAGHLLTSVDVFDVYRGKGIDSGRKSIALSLILQETSRTLTDEDADAVVQAVVSGLGKQLNARIRD